MGDVGIVDGDVEGLRVRKINKLTTFIRAAGGMYPLDNCLYFDRLRVSLFYFVNIPNAGWSTVLV